MELWPPVPKGTQQAFPSGRCPRCRSPRVHRSRTTTSGTKLLRALSPLRSFRCQACGWRGLRRPVMGDGPELSLPPLSDEVRARPRRGTRKDHPHLSQARRRWLLQVVVTLVLAALAGATVARLQ